MAKAVDAPGTSKKRGVVKPKFQAPEVAAVFDGYGEPVREKLLELRSLIFEVAAATEGVGPLEEALRWGEPSYLTTESGSGTTVRINQVRGRDDEVAVYVSCQTDLIRGFKSRYGRVLDLQGNRAIVLKAAEKLPLPALRHCIALALTYRRQRR